MKNYKRFIITTLCVVLVLSFPFCIFAETIVIKEKGHTITIEIGETEFTQSLTMNALQTVQPDMSLRPSTNPWTNTTTNMWGVGLNGVNFNDADVVYSNDHPYTLVGNGLCSRIMVQFTNIIPRSLHDGEDPSDPDVFRKRSIDVPGQYKLKDENGIVYYTYCVDVATDANLEDIYNGTNVEDADYYSSEDAAHIRYICLNGYWGSAEGLGSLDTFIDMLLAENVLTEDEAASLTPGEAMTATQAAIWSFGNSDLSFTVDSDVVVGPALKSYSFSSLDWDWLENYKANGNIIKKIYDYLVIGTVESSAETTVLTRGNSISDISVSVTNKVSDGEDEDHEVYTVSIEFTLGTDVLPDDELIVSIMNGEDKIAEVNLEEGKRTYTIDNLIIQENSEITFYLDGARQLSHSVYIFEAADPSVSQTLVGVASGTQYVGLKRSFSFNVVPDSPHTDGLDIYVPWIISQVLSFAVLVSAIIAIPKYIYLKRR